MFTAHDMKPEIVIYNNVGHYTLSPVTPVRAPKNGESLESVVNEVTWRLTTKGYEGLLLCVGTFSECLKAGRVGSTGADFNGWGYKYDAVNYKGRVDMEGEAQALYSKVQ